MLSIKTNDSFYVYFLIKCPLRILTIIQKNIVYLKARLKEMTHPTKLYTEKQTACHQMY